LRSNASIWLGPKAEQIACTRSTSAGWVIAANALSNAVNPIPALAAYRFAHSCPLMHSLAL
jgi:hypothetical protein